MLSRRLSRWNAGGTVGHHTCLGWGNVAATVAEETRPTVATAASFEIAGHYVWNIKHVDAVPQCPNGILRLRHG